MKKESELTFHSLTKDLGFIKVKWNGKVIYDDTTTVSNYYELKDLYRYYGNRFVYSMKVVTTAGHHCFVSIKGEKEYVDRYLVIGLLVKNTDIYEHDYLDASEVTIMEEVTDEKIIQDLKEYQKRFEYMFDRYGKFYRVEVKNKHGWLGSCLDDKMYIFKEDFDQGK